MGIRTHYHHHSDSLSNSLTTPHRKSRGKHRHHATRRRKHTTSRQVVFLQLEELRQRIRQSRRLAARCDFRKLLQWFSNYGTITCGLVGTAVDRLTGIMGWIIIEWVYFGISHLAHRSSAVSISWDEDLLPFAKVPQQPIEPNLVNPKFCYHLELVVQSSQLSHSPVLGETGAPAR